MQKRIWSMIVVRDNTVETVKHFDDYFKAQDYVDKFIEKIDKGFYSPVNYGEGEYYYNINEGLSIGIYTEDNDSRINISNDPRNNVAINI